LSHTPVPAPEATTSAQRRPLFRLQLNTLWVLEQGDGEPQLGLAPGLQTRQATPSDAEALELASRVSASTIRERLDRGCIGFLAELDGQIVAYCWVSFGAEEIGELECVIRLRPREAYVWDCATLPQHRGHGYYPWLLRHIVGALYDVGVRRIWIGSLLANRASQRGFAKSGFTEVATVVYARLLGLRFLRLVPAPGVAARLLAAAYDVLCPQF
jgi:GNAT superfamily N-acetyltransferase